MSEVPPRIIVIGNLANVGHDLARVLRTTGAEATLVMTPAEHAALESTRPDVASTAAVEVLPASRLGAELTLVRLIRAHDVAISVCLAGMHALQIAGRPWISYATGADLRELAAGLIPGRRLDAALARRTFRRAALILNSPDDGQIEMLRRLGVRRAVAWRQPVDAEFWSETPAGPADELVVFHPTSQQWVEQFPGQALKRNDILFRAFARFVNDGGRGRVRWLRRGQDVTATDELIDALGIGHLCEPIGTDLDRVALRAAMATSNVVADQFGVGTFGLIGLEALAAGRPLLAKVTQASIDAYPPDAPPPVLTGDDDAAIAQQLRALADAGDRASIGATALKWAAEQHGAERLGEWYLGHVRTALRGRAR